MEELMQEVQEARRIKMLHKPSKVPWKFLSMLSFAIIFISENRKKLLCRNCIKWFGRQWSFSMMLSFFPKSPPPLGQQRHIPLYLSSYTKATQSINLTTSRQIYFSPCHCSFPEDGSLGCTSTFQQLIYASWSRICQILWKIEHYFLFESNHG